mmetsp:Transcript_53457/g.141923  ORF Transcript_53457/g.141923 Transcript_53457/m.141923 type:complete len:267 (-) Transcript_53457:970-1770(-)
MARRYTNSCPCSTTNLRKSEKRAPEAREGMLGPRSRARERGSPRDHSASGVEAANGQWATVRRAQTYETSHLNMPCRPRSQQTQATEGSRHHTDTKPPRARADSRGRRGASPRDPLAHSARPEGSGRPGGVPRRPRGAPKMCSHRPVLRLQRRAPPSAQGAQAPGAPARLPAARSRSERKAPSSRSTRPAGGHAAGFSGASGTRSPRAVRAQRQPAPSSSAHSSMRRSSHEGSPGSQGSRPRRRATAPRLRPWRTVPSRSSARAMA